MRRCPSISRCRPRRAIAGGLAFIGALLGHAAQAQGTRSLTGAQDQFVTVDGHRLRYRVAGRGDAVVLLHGRANTIESSWSWMGDSLAQTHLVIALDQRGHGKSDKPELRGDYGPKMSSDVVALLNHLRIERVHVVGFSLGALVAANFVSRFSNRVRTVSLIAGPFFPDSVTAAAEAAQFIAEMESGVGYRGVFRRRGLSDSAVEASNARMMATSTPNALIAVTRSMADLLLTRERASSMSLPALVAVGTADELLDYNRKMAGWWPGARLIEVAGAGHGGPLQSPEVLAGIRELLKRR